VKQWLVLGALVVIVALLAAAAPAAPTRYEAPVPEEERARNAAILAALAFAGIERAWVDAGTDPLLVVYERPQGISIEVSQAFALGAAALVAPDSHALIARTTGGIEWRVATADVIAYQKGEIARGDLEARVEGGG